jgi:hypothetical protein
MSSEELAAQLAAWSNDHLTNPAENVQKLRQAVESSYPLPTEVATAGRTCCP